MAARTFLVALAVGLAATGCSDPLAQKLEADRPSTDGPAMEVDEDGDLVTARPTSTTTDPETTTAPPTTVPDRDTFTAQVGAICDEIFVAYRGDPPADPDGALEFARGAAGAYILWADRVEGLTPPDARIEANMREGLRRFRRATELFGPAFAAAVAGDQEGYEGAMWSALVAMDGASRALQAAGVPAGCIP